MATRRRALTVFLLLALVALGGLWWALAAGTVSATPEAIWRALNGCDPGGDLQASVIRELRLPRAAAAFAAGGLLALAGAVMQVLLRNPLADPYVLGISGGAGAAALLSISLGAAVWAVDAAAFAGALGAMLLVFGLAHGDGSWTQTRLLLTGVIVAAGCGAAVTLMLSMATETRVQSMLFWLMGDVSGASRPWPALLLLGAAVLVLLPFARDLNVLARGPLGAAALGVNVGRLRFGIYLVASLLTASAVTLVGSVGFVGLVVPHLVRLALGNDQRILLPAAAIGGGALLTYADTAARTLVAPQQLPVGVLTALIGVPVFLFLLMRGQR